MDIGHFYAVGGPSGSGKTTSVRAAVNTVPRLVYSVSNTTRPARPGEVHGKDYWFVSTEDFLRRADAQGFLEKAFVHGAWYGTGAPFVRGSLNNGNDVIAEVNWDGIVQLREAGIPVTSIAVVPPSMEDLERRLRARGNMTEEQIARRLGDAHLDMGTVAHFDYVITNVDFTLTVDSLINIIRSVRLRQRRAS